MNQKEERILARAFKPLDRLFAIVMDLERNCSDENFVVVRAVSKTTRCKKKLLKDLDKIQKIVDKLLGTE